MGLRESTKASKDRNTAASLLCVGFVEAAQEQRVAACDAFGAGQTVRDLHEAVGGLPAHDLVQITDGLRSEEHTSELQSQSNLVCRLLLEKKKKLATAIPGKVETDVGPSTT